MVAGTILGTTTVGIHHGVIADGTHPSIIPVGIAHGIMVATAITVVTMVATADMDMVSEMVIIPVSRIIDPVEAQELTELPVVADQAFQIQDV